MASNRRDLKAYVRYDGSGRIIPGSLILNRFKPKVGNWKETDAYQCCNSSGCGSYGYWWESSEIGPAHGIISQTDSKCNVYRLITNIYYYAPTETYYANVPVVQKFSPSGTLIWSKYLVTIQDDVPAYSRAANLQIDASDNIYVAHKYGYTKLDSDGNLLWRKYDDATYYYGSYWYTAIAIAPSGRVYLSGQQYQPDATELYNSIIEIDPATGDILNSKNTNYILAPYVTDNNDFWAGYTMTCDNDGNIISGINNYSGAEGYDTYLSGLYKVDADLNFLWLKVFDYDGNDFSTFIDNEVTSISIDSTNNIIVSLWWEGAVAKLDPDGNVLWSKWIGTTDSVKGSLRQMNSTLDAQGNIYAVGYFDTGVLPFPQSLVYVAKLDANGNLVYSYGYYNNVTSYAGDYWSNSDSSQFTTMSGNVLSITAASNLGDTGVDAVSLKLKDATISGVFGSLTFADIVSFTTVTDANIITIDGTPSEYATYIPDQAVTTFYIEDATVISVTTPIN